MRKSSLAKPCCSCEPFSFPGLCCALVHADQSWFELVLGSCRTMISGHIHYSLILQSWSSLFSDSWRFPMPASVGMDELHHFMVKWNGSELTPWHLVLCSAPMAWKLKNIVEEWDTAQTCETLTFPLDNDEKIGIYGNKKKKFLDVLTYTLFSQYSLDKKKNAWCLLKPGT